MIHSPMIAAAASHGPEHIPELLLALAVVLVGAKLAGEGVQRLGQPAVLGELLFGILVVFFVRMGMIVDVRSFGSASVLGFAAALTLAAIIGKMACGLVAPPGVSGLVVGFGMLPRGEVGLIFAGMGARLLLEGRPVVDAGMYAAAVFMVVMTTMAAPPLLLWSMKRAGADG